MFRVSLSSRLFLLRSGLIWASLFPSIWVSLSPTTKDLWPLRWWLPPPLPPCLCGNDRRIGELALTYYLYVFLWLSYRLELFFNLMRPKTVWLFELLDTWKACGGKRGMFGPWHKKYKLTTGRSGDFLWQSQKNIPSPYVWLWQATYTWPTWHLYALIEMAPPDESPWKHKSLPTFCGGNGF